MGSQPLGSSSSAGDRAASDEHARSGQPADYCREIETYLCRKNDGHLIRVVGPSFELVSRWASKGVPLAIAFRGIDRYFERYYRKGPRRRPVRIDFCEADVLDLFDEWRRALGLPTGTETAEDGPEPDDRRRAKSLPAHLERVVLRLTNARASGALGANADEVIDRVARELDVALAAHGLRGQAREALIERLVTLDRELMAAARQALSQTEQRALAAQADAELAPFRATMAPERYLAAREAAVDRLARVRFDLPVLTLS